MSTEAAYITTAAEPTFDALAKGFELEDYIIDSVLGAGGFGITYRAKDKLLDSWVAIKEYFPLELSQRDHNGISIKSNRQGLVTLPASEESYFEWGLARFLHEAQVLAQIKHPHVMRINRYFRAHGTAYIVMEYEAGETLAEILAAEETLSEDNIRGLLEDMFPALTAVHEKGYLHRDLKPANLYARERDGQVMLIDFGAARSDVKNNTKGVTVLISEGYSPPEQYPAAEEPAGPWSDIYALGAVMYHCATGRAPPEAVSRLLNNTLPETLSALESDYSPALLTLIERAMALRPQHRYQTIAAMQADLQRLSGLDGPANSMARPPPQTPQTALATPTSKPTKTNPTLAHGRSGSLRRVMLASSLMILALSVTGWYWWSVQTDVIPQVASSIVAQAQLQTAQQPTEPDATAVNSPLTLVTSINTTPTVPSTPAAVLDLIANPFAYLFDQPSALPTISVPLRAPTDANRTPIETLLAQAEESLKALKLTLPEQDSALYYYKQTLALEPDNTAAKQGISNIATTYAVMADKTLAKKKYSEAKAYIERGLNIDAHHKQLIALQKKLLAKTKKADPRRPRIAAKKPARYPQRTTIVRTVPVTEEESLLSKLQRLIESDAENTDSGFSQK